MLGNALEVLLVNRELGCLATIAIGYRQNDSTGRQVGVVTIWDLHYRPA